MKSGLFTEEFLQNLPSDILEASELICKEFDRLYLSTEGRAYNDYVEAYAILQAFSNSRQRAESFPQLGISQQDNVLAITTVFGNIKKAAEANLIRRRSQGMLTTKTLEYEAVFAKASYYEFSETDFNRIQVLMNEMRDLIRESALITADHKRRLLIRLEAMQAELHKKTRDIERFWSFIGEAGIVIRKFGEDAKPITDRVQELGKIVIAVIMAKEGIKALPEISKLLIGQ
jgi:hypothetical protein